MIFGSFLVKRLSFFFGSKKPDGLLLFDGINGLGSGGGHSRRLNVDGAFLPGSPGGWGGAVASPPLVKLGPCVGYSAINGVCQLAHLASQGQAPINRRGVSRNRRVNLQQQGVGIGVRGCHGGV